MLEGCSRENECSLKMDQLLYYGIGLGEDLFNEIWELIENILYSDTSKEERDEAINSLKAILGYFPEKFS